MGFPFLSFWGIFLLVLFLFFLSGYLTLTLRNGRRSPMSEREQARPHMLYHLSIGGHSCRGSAKKNGRGDEERPRLWSSRSLTARNMNRNDNENESESETTYRES